MHEHVGDTVQSSSVIEYSLNFTSSGVCVECFFMENDNSECIAVLHDRLSFGGVMNLSSHRFKRNGDTAYGCIDQFDHDKQQLGIIQFSMSSPGKCSEFAVMPISITDSILQ